MNRAETVIALREHGCQLGRERAFMLLDLYEQHAHYERALSWRRFVVGVLRMSAAESYRLIDQARVARAIAETASIDPLDVPLSARTAARVKHTLDELLPRIRELTAQQTRAERPAVIEQLLRDGETRSRDEAAKQLTQLQRAHE